MDMAYRDGELRVFIVAGEVSGDNIAYRLMASLNKLCFIPIRFSGIGGVLFYDVVSSMMSKQGLKTLFPMEDIAVMGICELLPHLSRIRARLKETVDTAIQFQPHVVVTVDSKGFSFRLLKQLRAKYSQQGMVSPVHFHYVAPSFWAWKGGEARLKGLSKFVDHILCILPFEEEVCRSNRLTATFVGHPTLEDALELKLDKDILPANWKIQRNTQNFHNDYGISSGTTVISLLPGSRLQEVTRMFPIFLSTMKILKDSCPELTTVIHVAPNKHVEEYLSRVVREWPMPMVLIPGGSRSLKYEALGASRVALCASGTVALELQLARLPSVVAYRAHFLTEWLMRSKAKIPYISLPNILLDSAVIPEVLFQACIPTKLASLLRDLINNEGLREHQITAAEKVGSILWPSERNISNLAQQDSRWRLPDWTPSMVAAHTILYYVKP